MSDDLAKHRLVVLFVVALLLLDPPLLGAMAAIAGSPLRFHVMVFVAWAAVIAMTAWLMERHPPRD